MKVTTYGIGGYDPTLPNDNIVDEWDDGQSAPIEPPNVQQLVQVDTDALAAALALPIRTTSMKAVAADLDAKLAAVIASMTPTDNTLSRP